MLFILSAVFIAIVGCLSVLLILGRVVFDIGLEVYAIHVAPLLKKSIDLKARYGEWALVTGATDGIGKGYVFALAAKGINVILVGRNETKMNGVIAEVKKAHPGVHLRSIIHDFTKSNPEDISKFTHSIKTVADTVSIVVNNVGVAGATDFDAFGVNVMDCPNPYSVSSEIAFVNINSAMLMVSLLAPALMRNKKGIFINIASIASIYPAVGNTVYSSTKAFLDFFGRGIRRELQPFNVEVQNVYPSFVKTKIVPDELHSLLPNWIAPEFMTYSSHAVETIGVTQDTYGCVVHRLIGLGLNFITRVLPPSLVEKVVAYTRAPTSKKQN